ncbi:MAG: TonB-dependent receptor [Bacteroidetes bacterium]|nr:TonB-dependent receptor [Bacteroidota bacterium]
MRRFTSFLIICLTLQLSSLYAISQIKKSDAPKDTTKSYKTAEVIVYGASKKMEKITDSPSAIISLSKEEIKTASRSNQIANALTGTPGVDILLNGTTDFIVNARGFNNGLNRRLLVLQDGRDLAMPLLGAQEWNSGSLPLEDFSRIELIKGPSSALYGANCFNGVLALTSYAPKEVIGTKVSLTSGDYKTFRGDFRNAGFIKDNITYKVSVGRSSSLNLSKSRTDSSMLEYQGVKLERRPISDDERNTYATYGTLRFDYDLSNDKRVVLEGGYSDSGNEVFVQPLGRVLVTNTQRPFARLAYNSDRWNFQASYMRRDVRDSMWLLFANRGPGFPLGSPILTDDDDIMFDLQYNNHLDDSENLHLIIGANQQFQNVNTLETTLKYPVKADYTGIYSQLDWHLTSKLNLVASARYDRATVHESQLSPRLAVVYSAADNHKIRLSASRSFQRPNYSELYRFTPDRGFNPSSAKNIANIDKSVTDSLKEWTGNQNFQDVSLGLNKVRGLAVGNSELKVEQNLGLELGYQGIFENTIFFTADVYYNKIKDFITNFGPSYNKNIFHWRANLDDSIAAYNDRVTDMVYQKLVGDDINRLSIYNGVPTLIQSVGNFGNVNQYGFDLSLNWYASDEWLISGNYSYYHANINIKPGEPEISSNTAPNKANISIQYWQNNSYDIKVTLQYVDTYKWISGATIGQVPAYTIVNLNAGYYIIENLEIGAYVFNLFNSDIIQIFGGTYLPRMANVKVTLNL